MSRGVESFISRLTTMLWRPRPGHLSHRRRAPQEWSIMLAVSRMTTWLANKEAVCATIFQASSRWTLAG